MTLRKKLTYTLGTIGLVGIISGTSLMVDGCRGHGERVRSNMPPEVRRMDEIYEQFENISSGIPKVYGYRGKDSRFPLPSITLGDILIDSELESRYKNLLDEYYNLKHDPEVIRKEAKYEAILYPDSEKLFYGLGIMWVSLVFTYIAYHLNQNGNKTNKNTGK